MNDKLERALVEATRTGALVRHRVHLETGEQEVRRLWLRQDVDRLLSPGTLNDGQRDRLKAALKRFVLGGVYNVVTRDCSQSDLSNLADIRELKTDPPPFIEMRFKPPKHHLRIFGRFICQDGLILSTQGVKSLQENTQAKPLNVGAERRRCDDIFKGLGLDLEWVPSGIKESLSNAKFI
jgi:hypothetical protein